MSDNNESTTPGMPAADVEFLIACLQNTSGGVISVDTNAIATALNYKNPKSVANRVSALKKKYNLPFGTTKGDTPKKASGAGGSNEPAVPSTPSKQRVTKARTPAAKKKATPKGKKGAKVEAEEQDAEMDEAEEDMAVKSPTASDVDDEAVSGKKEDVEEASDVEG